MQITREAVVLAVLAVVTIAYVATLHYYPQASDAMYELLKDTVLVILGYYVGSSHERIVIVRRTSRYSDPIVRADAISSSDRLRTELERVGYILVGFGIALILHHVVVYGVDWTIVSHEWIGLLALAAGMLLIGYAQHLMSRLVRALI